MWEKRRARIRDRVAREHGWAPWATGPAADAAMFNRQRSANTSGSDFGKAAKSAANAARRLSPGAEQCIGTELHVPCWYTWVVR